MTRANENSLCELALLAKELHMDLLKFQIPELKGLALEGTTAKITPLSHAARVIAEAMRSADEIGIPTAYDGLPFCSLPVSLRKRLNSLGTSHILYMCEVWETEFFRTDGGCRTKRQECLDCMYDTTCTGYYAGYDALGPIPIRPVFAPAAAPSGAGARPAIAGP